MLGRLGEWVVNLTRSLNAPLYHKRNPRIVQNGKAYPSLGFLVSAASPIGARLACNAQLVKRLGVMVVVYLSRFLKKVLGAMTRSSALRINSTSAGEGSGDAPW